MWHYWNYNKNKSYKDGQITIGFIKIKRNEDLWLLFHIGKITKDLNILEKRILFCENYTYLANLSYKLRKYIVMHNNKFVIAHHFFVFLAKNLFKDV